MRKTKTIFGRILLSNFLIVTICVTVLATILFAFFGNFAIGTKKETLLEEVMHISELTVYFQDNPSRQTASLYEMSINKVAQRVDGTVFLIDRDGKILFGSRNFPDHIKGTMASSYISRLFSGKYAQLGHFGHFFEKTYLLVSAPIPYHGETPAVACVAVPMPHLNMYRNSIFRTVLWAILITLPLSCLISYFIARRISKPLKNISRAAKAIMKGDFSVEVPVRGNDELASLSETFNQMTYSLQKLEDMRSAFIADVSHELRTPMTTISGFIEGILDETIPPDRHGEYLSIVLSEAKRLSRLVNELLLVARMDEGLTLKKTEFDLNELIRISILRFESVFTEKNIDADIKFDAEACPIYADKDALDRVFINLFDNALKFNKEGGYVRVAVSQTDSSVLISVENSGEGISEADLKLIFDKFYKTDPSRGKDKTGVGLGLYLVRNIISLHGGKINVESIPEEYTRFTVSLPKK